MKQVPDFVVVGGLRTGSTTLHGLLVQVPSICMTRFKEPDFFLTDQNMSKGLDWYGKLYEFPEKVCGEVSPNYSSVDRFPGVAERIHDVAPDAKIVYIVRDPVDRARSHYSQAWLQGDGLPDPARLDRTPEGRHIIDGSRYYLQLKPYLDTFGEENLLVLDFRTLIADPQGTIRKFCDFVGAPISDEELSRITHVRQNSTEYLGSVPRWWTRTAEGIKKHDSALVRGLYHLIPLSLAKRVKSAVTSATEERKPPAFTETAQEIVKEAVAEDADRLREFTGREFDHWKV